MNKPCGILSQQSAPALHKNLEKGWLGFGQVTAGLFPLVQVVSAAKPAFHFRPQWRSLHGRSGRSGSAADLPTFGPFSLPPLSPRPTSPMMTLMHSIMATPSRRAQVRHLGLNLLMGGSSVGCWEVPVYLMIMRLNAFKHHPSLKPSIHGSC